MSTYGFTNSKGQKIKGQGDTPIEAYELLFPGKSLLPVGDVKKATVRAELLDGQRISIGFYTEYSKPISEKVSKELLEEVTDAMRNSLFEDDEDTTAIARMNELRGELSQAADDYYNGTERMSNFEYDKKFDELRLLESKYGNPEENFTDKVGAELEENTGLQKVTHEFEAKSLSKTKDVDELVKEQSKTSEGGDGESCLSWKLDGCTLQLTYEGGKLVLVATRGDGKVGQDITKNSKYIDGIPQKISDNGKLVVRGEALMSYAEFDRLNTEGQYANPRNLASATITALDKKVLEERKVEFKAFEIVYSEFIERKNDIRWSFAERLDVLKKEGFDVVPHEAVKVKDLKDAIARWSVAENIDALGYPVDGLVVAYNNVELVKDLEGTGHHPSPTKAMAFKWADETVSTVLREIEWSPSRTGLLNPVAVFDTVELCGTKVSRASLHNVSYIKTLNLKVGDRITVYKANMIIPQVAENLDKSKGVANVGTIHCPCCDRPTVIVDNGGTLTMQCENKDCSAKRIGTFTHYVEKHGMNIEGLSEKTILTLMEHGLLKNLSDLYHLDEKKDTFVEIEGFGEKSYDKLIASIEKSRKTDTEHFLYACGIEGISRGQIKEIVRYIRDNWDKGLKKFHKAVPCEGIALMGCLISMAYQDYPFDRIEGIGNVLAQNLQRFLDDEIIFPMEESSEGTLPLGSGFYECMKYLTFMDKAPSGTTSGGSTKLAGKTFVITGSLTHFANRDGLVSVIEQNGGKVSGSVSAQTSYLVNNDVTSTSSKNKKAKALSVPIISEDELLAMLQ